MKNNIVTAFALAALLLASCAPSQKPADNAGTEIQAGANDAIANTKYGKIAGFTQNGLNIFKGIPYAKANRFEAPEAPIVGMASAVAVISAPHRLKASVPAGIATK